MFAGYVRNLLDPQGQTHRIAQTHADNVIIGAGVAMSSEVTFHDFAALANRKGWTPEFLAVEFRGSASRSQAQETCS